jgi:hypothetical protein
MSVSKAKSGRFHATVRIGDTWANVGTYDTDAEAHAAADAEYARIKDGTSILLRASGEVLDKRAYSARIGVPPGTVGRWMSEGMPTLPIGGGAIRVDVSVADAWVKANHPKSVSFGRESLVYFTRRDSDDAIKIGMTADVLRRVPELRKGKDYAVVLLAAVPGDKPLELRIHARFAAERIDPDDEWFRGSDRLVAFVESLGRNAA